MEITEVRIKLMEGSEDRLRAFCSVTLDQSFVVRDLKIIDGSHGPFVAMPSRKLTGHCNRCGGKNHLRATFCNQCGVKLQNGGTVDAPQKLYADVAHPINSECREMIQNAVIDEFNAELQRAAQPNYRSRYDDEFDAGDYEEADYSASTATAPTTQQSAVGPVDEPSVSSEQAPIVTSSATDGGPGGGPGGEKSDDAELDSFGAGLFDSTPPASDQSPEASESNTHDEDAIVVRGESGVQNSLPRPHFRDRPGGVSRGLVPSTPPSRESRGNHDEEHSGRAARQDTPEDSGFGAGIFDG